MKEDFSRGASKTDNQQRTGIRKQNVFDYAKKFLAKNSKNVSSTVRSLNSKINGHRLQLLQFFCFRDHSYFLATSSRMAFCYLSTSGLDVTQMAEYVQSISLVASRFYFTSFCETTSFWKSTKRPSNQDCTFAPKACPLTYRLGLYPRFPPYISRVSVLTSYLISLPDSTFYLGLGLPGSYRSSSVGVNFLV